jgi:DNA-binding NarL/FixJ family response regulator
MISGIVDTTLKQTIRILLVDDQPSVRQGLRMWLGLEPGFKVVGEASDGSAALEFAQRLQPDVVVMDVEMPKMDGITAAWKLHELYPRIAIIMLSMYGGPSISARAKRAGAAALVEKRQEEQDLLAAIRNAVYPGGA